MGNIMRNGISYTGSGGGGGDSGMELTYDEYLALSEEEKTNGTTYYVKDINGAGEDQFQPIIYSEEEREIGVWTDGKPLYQKTIHTGALSNTTNWVSIPHGITNIDKVIKCTGIAISPDNYYYAIPQYRTTYNVGVTLEISETDINYTQTWLNSVTDSYVTLQYTKTTDQPGSGTWTPQGVPAVHYSTEEQVVGIWVDGSTLYEKTYVGTIGNYDSSIDGYLISTDIDVTTIKELINIDGSLKSIDTAPAFASLNGLKNTATWSADIHINRYGILLWTGNSSYGSKFAGGKAVVTIRYTKQTS